MAGERDPARPAAMRDQHAFRHAGGVRVVDALDLETGQFRLDAVGDGDVGNGTAAVQRDEVAGQFGDGRGRIGHAPG